MTGRVYGDVWEGDNSQGFLRCGSVPLSEPRLKSAPHRTAVLIGFVRFITVVEGIGAKSCSATVQGTVCHIQSYLRCFFFLLYGAVWYVAVRCGSVEPHRTVRFCLKQTGTGPHRSIPGKKKYALHRTHYTAP